MSRLVENIIRAVAEQTGVTRKEMMNGETNYRVTDARYMVAYLLRKRHGWLFSDIGKVFGLTGHTMSHGFHRIDKMVKGGKTKVPRISKKELRAERVIDEISEQLFEAIVRVI